MATFTAQVAQANVELTGTDNPIVLSSEALDVIVSKYDGQYETTAASSYEHSSVVNGGLAGIPATSLPLGSTWLVYYQASFGSSTSSGMVDCFLHAATDPHADPYFTQNPHIVLAHGWAECTGHGTPMMMNGSYMAGMLEYTSNGTYGLDFRLRSTQGVPVQVGGMQIVAIRTDEKLTKSQADGDYWYAEQSSSAFGTASATYEDVFSTTYTPTISEDFWLIVSSEANIPLAEQVNMRVLVDGVQQLNQWIKESADNRDVHSFFFSHKISLSGGSAHTITVQVRKQTGANFVFVERTRITLFRLVSFSGHSYTQEYLPSFITAVYPGWEPVLQATHSPATSGEYVLAIANGLVFREQPAASLMRLVNTTTGASMQEFASTSAPVPALSGLNESTVLTSGSAEAVSTPNTYQVHMSGESGYDTGPPQGYPSWRVSLMTLGLAKVVGPQNVFISGTDFMGMSDYAQGDLETPVSGTETMRMGDFGSIVSSIPSGLPTDYPRAWIRGNDRVAYWQAQYAGLTAQWDQLVNSFGYGDFAFTDAMAYLASGDTTYLNRAFAFIDEWMVNQPLPGMQTSSWHAVREFSRDLSLTYQFIHDELGATRRRWIEDELMGIVYLMFSTYNNPTAAMIAGRVAQGNTSVAPEGKNAGHNFFNNYIFMLAHAAVALHPSPATFKWPPVTGSDIEFIVPANNGDTVPSGMDATYSSLLEFLQDRFEFMLFPTMSAPSGYMIGGGFPAGVGYGTGARMYHMEMFAMLKSAGLDYTIAHPYLQEIPAYEFYVEEPRKRIMLPIGEFAGSVPGWGTGQSVNNYNRHIMIAAADAFAGTEIGRQAQHWCDTVYPMMNNNPTNDERTLDFLMYRTDRAATDPETIRPAHYVAAGTGLINSRDSWGDNGVSVSGRCGHINFNNECADAGHITIFKDDALGNPQEGYLLTEVQPWQNQGGYGEGRGDLWPTLYHNTYVIDESKNHPDTGVPVTFLWSQRSMSAGATRPEIKRNHQTSEYSYFWMDGKDIYWITRINSPTSSQVLGASLRTPINDIFHREVVHFRDTNVVLVYDRMRVVPNFQEPGTVAEARWFTRNTPTDFGGGISMASIRDNRLFKKTMFGGSGSAGTNFVRSVEAFTHPTLSFQMSLEKIRMAYSTGTGGDFVRLMTAMQAGDSTTLPSMVQTDSIESSGPAAIGGTMDGVTVRGTPRRHVLFSAEQDGSTPSSVTYAVLKQNDSDKHYVYNLVPGQEYFITETDIGSGYFRYTFAETFSIGFIANEAGIVEFQPGELVGQGATPIRGTDATLSMIDSGTLTVGVLSDGTDATLSMIDSGQVIFNGVGDIVVTGQEIMEPMVETGRFPGPAAGTELMGMADSGRLIYDPATPPPPTWSEKKIFRGNVAFYPNENRGSTFFTYEPQDMGPHEILSDESDNTFIRTFPTLFGQRLILLSVVEVGLDDPAGFSGVIRTIRFVVRVRYANVAGVLNPVLVCALRHNGTSLAQVNVPIENVLSSDVVEVQSSPISVNINTSTMRECSLRIQPRATTYSDNYQVELSAAWVETTGRLNEKVISR